MSDQARGTSPAAGTTWRFVLLLLLFVFGSYAMWSFLMQDLSGSSGRATFCVLAAGLDPGAGAYNYANALFSQPQNFAAYQACEARLLPDQVWVPIGITAGLVLAAVILYFALPTWKSRSGSGVLSLDKFAAGTSYATLREPLKDLVADAQIPVRYEVDFGVDPWAATVGAVVFGRRPKYTIVLNGGLLATHKSEPERFRAVVLHELAHISNRDVDITYLVITLWRVFLFGALLPALADTIYDITLHDHWAWSWGYGANDIYFVVSLLVIVGLTYLARADILRFREVAADVTAARWQVGSWPWHPDPGTASARSSTGLLRTHPDWKTRQQAIVDSSRLLEPTALTMLLTGAGATITADQFNSAPFENTPWGLQLQAMIAAGFMAIIGGGMLWRSVGDAVTNGRPALTGIGSGIWLGLGLVVAEFVTGYYNGRSFPAHPEAYLILMVLASLAFTWFAQVAQLAAAPGHHRLGGLATATGLAALWLLLGYVMYQWYSHWTELLTGWPFSVRGDLRLLGVTGAPLAHPGAILTTTTVLLALSVDNFSDLWWILAVLWLVPLVLWCARQMWHDSRWLMRALVIGSASGVVGGISTVGFAITLRGTRYLAADLFVYVCECALVLGGACVAAAVIAVLTAGRYRLLSAMTAAATSAVLGLLGQYAVFGISNCRHAWCSPLATGSWTFTELIGNYVLTLGVMAAAIAALGVAAVGPGARRDRYPTDPHGSSLHVKFLVVAASLVCLATTGAIGAVSATTGGSTGGSSSSGSQSAATAVAQGSGASPASSALATLQFEGWMGAGGTKIIHDLASADREIGALLRTGRSPAAACTAVSGFLREANAYFTIPNAAGQVLWSRLLAGFARVSTDCTSYLASATTADARALVTDAVAAASPNLAFLHWFQHMARLITRSR